MSGASGCMYRRMVFRLGGDLYVEDTLECSPIAILSAFDLTKAPFLRIEGGHVMGDACSIWGGL